MPELNTFSSTLRGMNGIERIFRSVKIRRLKALIWLEVIKWSCSKSWGLGFCFGEFWVFWVCFFGLMGFFLFSQSFGVFLNLKKKSRV